MATHVGLGQGLRVMRDELTRSSLSSLRKESLVDVVISLAFTTRSIPGIRGHLEAAYKTACSSPSCGGGMDAALKQLACVAWQPDPAGTSLSCDVNPEASTQGSSSDTAIDGDVGAPSTGGESATGSGPLCRSLWKGRGCEDPDTCDRVHKPLCSKESCKSARDPTCHDWHYRPKKKRSFAKGSTPTSSSKPLGNSRRGKTAPNSKSANNKSLMHLSQAKDRMYLKWQLSKMELEQSKLAAATYRDILVSGQHIHTSQARLRDQPFTDSVLAQRRDSGPATKANLSPAMDLGSIVSQLQTIMAALSSAGIMGNKP